MRNLGVALAVVLVAGFGFACKPKGGGGKPKVAVSIFPLHDITKRIAGDRLDVVLVLPPGKSEHGYDPTPKEIARLEGTKLGIAVGLDMDGWVENIMKSAGGSPRMVHVGEKVPTIPIDVEPVGEEEGEEHHEESEHHEEEGGHHEEEHHHAGKGSPDPHFWLDPQRMSAAVDVIAGELTTLDPAGKDAFARNAAAVKASLAKLDGAIDARAKAWSKKTIVTFHGSMSYYAARYGLRIAAVVEPLAGKEPTPQYVAEVLAAIQRGQAAALFSEPQLDRRPAEVIATEGKIPLGELDPVGGAPGRDSYEALLTWNTDQLEKLLK
ncbi:MAG TPA: metal ABC transporter substrate-binding protein [Kofleriaceae bacterium]|nr:metal ABC transporter substrate-binding protein [Kofleriaceae bacterium]